MERVWLSRLRWRLRGAWLWPTFLVLTALDTALLRTWPLAGLRTEVVPAFLLAGFINLAAVAAVAPVVGRLVRRRRADLPQIIAADYAGVVLLLGVTGVFVAIGLTHHGAVQRERRASGRAVALARAALRTDAPPTVRRNVAFLETIRVDPERLYRSCVPSGVADRPWCVLVHLDTRPPRVVFGGRQPNALWDARGG